ncbi:hypothetical protein Sa4125_33030 [Aureimonas sp. SA4125]|uniref:hypothetical protein n=1 Tax=Aureimonas sp. SA4125 TaxID=2826993 RepID=UPI001CC44C94|nr:hypothetical protein [Aureimonas sp. SA4125]BDA85761.1 hypothetical protein Sa4125_33030 [Aureimonas sp. SA4125]
MVMKFVRLALAAAALAGFGFGAGQATAAPSGPAAAVATAPGTMLLAQRYERGRGCEPRRALRKAYRLGLNRPVIVRDNRNVVVVDGRKRGRVVTVRFAQARGCPVLRIR